MKSILDRTFRYTKSVDTDLRETFARIRREQKMQVPANERGSGKIVPIKPGRRTVAA
jgi:hypothetical protein